MTRFGTLWRAALIAAFVGLHFGILVNKWLGVAMTIAAFAGAYDGIRKSPA